MDSLVFLDVETTGLDGYKDRVVEIYMLKLERSGEVQEYHTMINPERPIPEYITSLTGSQMKMSAMLPRKRMSPAKSGSLSVMAPLLPTTLTLTAVFWNRCSSAINVRRCPPKGSTPWPSAGACFPGSASILTEKEATSSRT